MFWLSACCVQFLFFLSRLVQNASGMKLVCNLILHVFKIFLVWPRRKVQKELSIIVLQIIPLQMTGACNMQQRPQQETSRRFARRLSALSAIYSSNAIDKVIEQHPH